MAVPERRILRDSMQGIERYRTLVIHGILVLAILAVFAQVAGFEFVGFDDLSYVAENPHVQSGLTRANIAWAFTTSTETHWAPLTWLSFMLDSELGGVSPRVFHLTNLALHAANASLLFYVLTLMTGCVWRSGFVAMLFAIHPLHVESVAWVTERKDVLSALFFLLAIWAYARYVARLAPLRYALVVLAFALGLLSKSMVVTLPLVLLVLDVWPLGRFRQGIAKISTSPRSESGHPSAPDRMRPGTAPSSVVAVLAEKIPLMALSAVVSVVAISGQMRSQTLGTLEQFPLRMRVANALVSAVTYIQKMFWPSGLAAPYPYSPELLTPLRVTVCALVLACISALAIWTLRSRPYLTAGWLWYLITLLPVSGLIQAGAQGRADRYTYIPLIGPSIMIAWGVPGFLASWSGEEGGQRTRDGLAPRRKLLVGATAAIVLTALAAAAHTQASYWRTTSDLFGRVLQVTDRNAIAHNGLGLDLFEKGRLEDAIAQYESALGIWPSYVEAHVNLATALARSGKVRQAVTHYREAQRLRPGDPDILAHLGAALLEAGEIDEALGRLREAARLAPNDAFTHEQLGAALARQGRGEETIVHLREVVRLKPGDARARINLGIALLGQQSLAEAEAEFVQAIRVAPGDPSAHKNLGVVLAKQGRIREAVDELLEAVRLDPSDEGARKNLERAQSMLEAPPAPR